MGNKNVQLVLQNQCCKTSQEQWCTFYHPRITPVFRQIMLACFGYRWRTWNIAFQLSLQQYRKTSCTIYFSVARYKNKKKRMHFSTQTLETFTKL